MRVQASEDLDGELSRKVKDMSLHVNKLNKRRGPAGSYSVSRYVGGAAPQRLRLPRSPARACTHTHTHTHCTMGQAGFSHSCLHGRERHEWAKDKVGSMNVQSSSSKLTGSILQMERDQKEFQQNGEWIHSLRSMDPRPRL